MFTIKGINHINVVVPEIDEAARYYADLLGAAPIQSFPRFKNIGFAKSAGFLLDPQNVSVTIRFLTVPPQNAITLELMEYHEPAGLNVLTDKHTNDVCMLGHISLSIENID